MRCEYAKLKTSQLETWWEGATPAEPATAVNGKKVLATPKWAYTEALDKINGTVTQVIEPGHALSTTTLVDDTAYRFQLVANESEVPAVKAQARYGFALMLVLMLFPILTTCATFIPGVRPVINWARLHLVYPPLFGRRHMQLHPWFFGNVPTLGQSIYIFLGFALTVIFMGPSYKFAGWPNSVGPNVYDAVLNWVMRRTGLLGCAILAVVFMFAGRNSPVLYLSE
ncbi:hypothetical protein CLAFUW4_12388 [Fulvia fulva]|uniref:Uncharacterized protein n=1 Tax=Passalora fulva TaxID=5499 RepID=A0A9Q8USM0_PASFU|nr:uncharacterized protein CLAFUR5_11417 [Fulvia fulva]KAK4617521.1 hypothetical protein CLAFUR4_12393 [Fulvia fulva]KAK4619106.1 hypothetical protein CLAFUR0_12404 [Fulvia fulva]UJO20922.1 hypothetical protein CLAFUR5_11417 [Fulvia fulva]WPV18185.1 hypothetical protein CLAFUW4_12388 [Fulvia fulva]WPV33068.1 hypothetical protein CLAFUW7_12395 [Fulvia fulva]